MPQPHSKPYLQLRLGGTGTGRGQDSRYTEVLDGAAYARMQNQAKEL